MAASSENLAATIDPFLLRHCFSDYFWPTPAADHDDFNLLHLLQQQQQQQQQLDHHQYQNQSFSPFSSSDLEQHQHKPTPSASDPEISTAPKRRTTTAVNGKARITKRKSRANKKNQTTFITADPANFRQMVQQVTGIRFDAQSSSSTPHHLPPLSHLLKPDIGRLYNACLPTLDTSSFLLDHHHSLSLIADRPVYGGGGLTSAHSATGEASGYAASDGFTSFPTLESWKVM